MTDEELLALHREAQVALAKYPGVTGVGLGLKESGGKVTDQVAFRVYVVEKKDAAELAPEEMIPRQYKGVPTDVLKVREITLDACEITERPGTLVGGLTISTLVQDAGGAVGSGTLGFFATIDGAQAPDNIALITNHHVVADGASPGTTVYLPNYVTPLGGTPQITLDKDQPIGKIKTLQPEGPFTPPGGQASYLDCASVQLNICISSWCHTNCGVSFANEIRGLNVAGGNKLLDVGTAAFHDSVVKVGRSTSRTVGQVVDIALPYQGGVIIEIAATQNDCNGVLRFSAQGDSGSAVVRTDGKLVGLLFGHVTGTPSHSAACHIGPVLAALGVKAITSANPVHDNPAAEGMRADGMAIVDGRPNQTGELRRRFLGCDEGRRIADLVELHRREVVHLVNHRRRVTVTWHRNQGPAFLNRAIHNARDPEIQIPHVIDGVEREQLLRNMAAVLTEHGSAVLGAAIEQHRDEVLAFARSFDNLHDLVEALRTRKAS